MTSPQTSRTILHCDMNNCFASIEALLNPDLRNRAIAVCGAQEERHGIVLAKSEQAKRCGVKTGDAIWQAKQKCPQILIVPPHFEEYKKYSHIASQLYQQYTDQVEAFGLDECWLDVSGSQNLFGSGMEIAETIRKRMKYEVGLTVSIGVSFNKIFAKLGSDLKKPDAITEIPRDQFVNIVHPLPVSNLLGVGPATLRTFSAYCIRTIGHLAHTDVRFLHKILGKHGVVLWQYANGLDMSPVQRSNYHEKAQSVGHGITAARDLLTTEAVWHSFLALSLDVARHLREMKMEACGIQIVIRDSQLLFHQWQAPLRYPIRAAQDIAHAAMTLFTKNYNWEIPVRALTVRATQLRDILGPRQLDLFYDTKHRIKLDKVENSLDSIREKYGNAAIQWASLSQPSELPEELHFGTTLPSPSRMMAGH